jgi:hypothetical protein
MTGDRIPGTLNLFLLAGAICIAATLLSLASHAASAWTVLAAAVMFSYVNNTVFSAAARERAQHPSRQSAH